MPPQSISARYGNQVGLREGMICSNEPGYYEAGAFGIRIENLLVVRKRSTKHEMRGRQFLGFDQLTHVPIQVCEKGLPSEAVRVRASPYSTEPNAPLCRCFVKLSALTAIKQWSCTSLRFVDSDW
eukprot:scaffold43845_cov33-Tisochrysis_lutea.AAC.5